jgi:hypothetical protein
MAGEPVRTWTSADGRTLQAQYIESSAGKVTIKMGSREYTLPLSRFSQADQDYVAGVANQPPPAYQPITKAKPRDARKFYREEDDWEGYLLGGAIVVDFTGDVQIKAPTPEGTEERYGPDWADPKKEQVLTAGYQLRTLANSTIRLLLTNGTLITLSPESEGKILTYFQEPISASDRTFQETTTELSPSMVKFELSLGELIVETKKLNKSSSFDIHSPLGVAGIRGTAFRLRVDKSKQSLDVIRGQVDCQQGKGRVTSVIGGQANTATRGRISDPEDIAFDAGQQIEQACASLGKEVGGRTVAQLSQAHEKANPPLEISIQADGFEAALRQKIRRPRGKILQEDYDRVGSIEASSENRDTANLKDLRFVQKLRNLTKINLTGQSISDLKPLVYCKNLKNLFFHGMGGLDFSVLSDLKKLENLKLHGVGSVKLPHKLPPNLNSIVCSGESYIKSWDLLKNLGELRSLMVSPTADFSSISKFKTLKFLTLEMAPEVKEMPELTIFQSFQNLETLTFYFRGVEKTLTVDDLNKLKVMLPEVEIQVTGGK